VYYRTCLESRFSILNTPIVFSYPLAKRSTVGLLVSTSVANVLNYNKWSQNFDERPHCRGCFMGEKFNVTFNCISSRQRDRHCCTCTHWRTCTRCCLLAGSAEDSIIFTRWRQCAAHPTNALFLQPALVSPLNGISIRPAVFALPTHWSRPTERGNFRVTCGSPFPPNTDHSIVYLQASKSMRKATFVYSILSQQFCIIIDLSIPIIKICITKDPSLPITNLRYKWSTSSNAKRFSLIIRS